MPRAPRALQVLALAAAVALLGRPGGVLLGALVGAQRLAGRPPAAARRRPRERPRLGCADEGSEAELMDEEASSEGTVRLSEDSSPEEFLDQLVAAGIFEDDPAMLTQLRALVARGVHPLQVLRPSRPPPPEEKPLPKILESFDLEGIARHIAAKECKKVVVMCGAGISTSAGIPDFRTPGTGLYDNLKRFDLPRPEAIFELGFFRKKPAAFYELAKEMWPGNFRPTPAHYFIRLLELKGLLLRCYSQNIDSLERQAGLSSDRLIAAHGNFDGAHVIDTDPEQDVPIEELKAAVLKGEEGWQALKEKYGNLVKPKIVFFGENLPDRFYALHEEDLQDCDLLIVLGTSLVVHPFASLVGLAKRSAPRLLINRDPAGRSEDLEFGFRFDLKEDANSTELANWRDAWHEGDCDSGCRALAAALGWGADLEALIDSEGAAAVEKAPWASRL